MALESCGVAATVSRRGVRLGRRALRSRIVPFALLAISDVGMAMPGWRASRRRIGSGVGEASQSYPRPLAVAEFTCALNFVDVACCEMVVEAQSTSRLPYPRLWQFAVGFAAAIGDAGWVRIAWAGVLESREGAAMY